MAEQEPQELELLLAATSIFSFPKTTPKSAARGFGTKALGQRFGAICLGFLEAPKRIFVFKKTKGKNRFLFVYHVCSDCVAVGRSIQPKCYKAKDQKAPPKYRSLRVLVFWSGPTHGTHGKLQHKTLVKEVNASQKRKKPLPMDRVSGHASPLVDDGKQEQTPLKWSLWRGGRMVGSKE